MKVYAVADVHYPRFEEAFAKALTALEPPDMFLLAGDIVNRGTAGEFPHVLDAIDEALGNRFPIIGCFGNEEYSEVRGEIQTYVENRMTLLDEQSTIINFNGKKIGIVGTQGSLDKPTSWQKRNIPGIKDIFERRAGRAESLLKRIASEVDYRILLMHYSPCIETCKGEDLRSFAWLGSRKFYRVISEVKPDLVIHGHVHNSKVHEAKVGATLVRNVALPAVGRITELEITL
ncbi:MAG: metallophosphoesterase family protein [Candidatus Thorarchaeota archaeon]|jgi:Icc-related predicted phosphoesterase